MAQLKLDENLFKLLQKIDTPTVCNSIEVAQGQRGFNRFTKSTVLCSDPTGGAIVGYARTAQIAASNPPQADPNDVRSIRMAYYQYMAESPQPSVVVIEDIDYPHAVGAYWGEINSAVHKAFGLNGTLTNGVMRDLGDLPDNFPIIAGSIGPSHGFVHVLNFDKPVTVFDLQICPGELIHADRHGAVVIPKDIIPALYDAIQKLLQTEQLVLEPARQEGFDFSKFKAAWTAFEKSRT